jgi:hypothetical protein
MPSADERLKPMQGLHGFATQTRIKTDKVKRHNYDTNKFPRSALPFEKGELEGIT